MNNNKFISSNPIGIIGRFAGIIMNMIHEKDYSKIVSSIRESSNNEELKILDIGCGGGIVLKLFSKYFKDSYFYGIDHSNEMVTLSKRTNLNTIKSGKTSIILNSVESISFDSKMFDIITIFDNINFWENYSKAFSEIYRVLKDSGKIYIVNGYPPPGSKWFEFVKFKDQEQYSNLLNKNGFIIDKISIEKEVIIIESIKKIEDIR